jgi:hypothetical protein
LATGVCFENDCTDDSNICPFYQECTDVDADDVFECTDISCTENSDCLTNFCESENLQTPICRPCDATEDCDDSQECYDNTGICYTQVTCGIDNVNCELNETCSADGYCVAPTCDNWYECPNDTGCVQGIC